MKNTLSFILILSCFISPLRAGNCASKVEQEPRRTAWAPVAPATAASMVASSKRAKEKAVTKSAISATALVSVAPLSTRDNETAHALKRALPVSDVLNIVIQYLTGSLEHIKTFTGHTDEIFSVQSMNNNEFVSGSRDGVVNLWNADSGKSHVLIKAPATFNNKPDFKLSAEKGDFHLVKLNEDHFVFHSSGQKIELWSVSKRKKMKDFETLRLFYGEYGDYQSDETIDVIPLSATEFATVEHLNWGRSKICQFNTDTFFTGFAEEESREVNFRIKRIAKLDAENLILAGTDNGSSLRLYNRFTQNAKKYALNDSEVQAIAALDSQHFVTILVSRIYLPGTQNNGRSMHTIKLWHKDPKNSSKIFDCFDASYVAALDANHFVTGHFDGKICIWHKDRDRHLADTQAHSQRVTCLGKVNEDHFISGSADGSIKLWNLGQASKLKTIIAAHTAALNASATAAKSKATVEVIP